MNVFANLRIKPAQTIDAVIWEIVTMQEDRSREQGKTCAMPGEGGILSSLAKGYLFGIFLLAFLLGIIFTHGLDFSKSISEYALETPLHWLIILSVVYVQTSQRRSQDTLNLKANEEGAFYFASRIFHQSEVDCMTISRSLFSNVLSVHIKLRDGNNILLFCSAGNAKKLKSELVNISISDKRSFFWLKYIFYLLLAFVVGAMSGLGSLP